MSSNNVQSVHRVPLTDTRIRNAKAKAGKAVKLYDGEGLFLLVTPEGKKRWRFRYLRDGKETVMALGEYPTVSLAEARGLREARLKDLVAGIDPVYQRKAAKEGRPLPGEETVRQVGQEWFEKQKRGWRPTYVETVQGRLERDVFPYVGDRPVRAVKPPELRAVLQRVENRGAVELAHRIHNLCDRIFRYAVATGRVEWNPAADLGETLAPSIETNFAAVIKPKDFAPIVRKLDSYQGSFIVECGLKLAPRLFVRPIELRYMEWTEIDFDDALWTIPATKMKGKREHSVPLARQALNVLQELRQYTGKWQYTLPSLRSATRPISDGTLNAAMVEMGIGRDVQTVHGFRATARTMLAEVLKYPGHIIDHQLAHVVKDPNGTAYNRTAFLGERREMMQRWADYLDELRDQFPRQ